MKNIVIIIGVIILIGILYTVFTSNNNEEKEKVMDISATEFQQQKEQEPGIVIDVRTQEEYDEGHLAEVDHHYNLTNGDFESQLESLDKDETYYLYCRTGNRSGQAAQLMIQNGFENVYNIGGFQDLVAAGIEGKK